jgi:hypothetical protein
LGESNRKITGFLKLVESLRKKAVAGTLSELMRAVIEDTGYLEKLQSSDDLAAESRIDNLNELQGIALTIEVSVHGSSGNSSNQPVQLRHPVRGRGVTALIPLKGRLMNGLRPVQAVSLSSFRLCSIGRR